MILIRSERDSGSQSVTLTTKGRQNLALLVQLSLGRDPRCLLIRRSWQQTLIRVFWHDGGGALLHAGR